MLKTSDNNKRIAKNTAFLYIRMLLLMAISIYTTRVNLQVLGIEDYGIYNVVGGIVALFSVLSQSLSTASSRFLNFEMGRGNENKLKKIFGVCSSIHIILMILIAVLTELIGTWFLNNKMVIPTERLYAANWVFQFSILTFCINLMSVPYNAAIIAHEKMSAFAYISIYEGVAKLGICYFVLISSFDKLIFYAALLFFVQLSIRVIYSYYCKKKFEECHSWICFDKNIFKEIFSYAGWNFIGTTAAILRTQGGNIIINMFAGPVVNASRGVANQVNNAITGFASNFITAIRPQITKSYAAGNIDYMTTLVVQGARLSYYMLFILSLPIIININFILNLWLKDIPDRADIFVILTIVFTMIETLSNTLITAQLATGKVRNYQLIVGGINMLNLPISYILLKLGCLPEVFLYVAITLSIMCLIARLIMLKQNIVGFSISTFLHKVVINCLMVTVVALSISIILKNLLPCTFVGFLLSVISCVIFTAFVILKVGCDTKEREYMILAVRKVKNKFIK